MSKLSQQASTWKPETMLERFVRCRAMLYVHGFLSQAESDKVHQRLTKAARTELFSKPKKSAKAKAAKPRLTRPEASPAITEGPTARRDSQL